MTFTGNKPDYNPIEIMIMIDFQYKDSVLNSLHFILKSRTWCEMTVLQNRGAARIQSEHLGQVQ
jgi:hypothetical protein